MPNLFRRFFVKKSFLGPLILDPGHRSSPLSLKDNGSRLYIALVGSELAKVPRTKSPKDIAKTNVKFFIAVCPCRFRKELKIICGSVEDLIWDLSKWHYNRTEIEILCMWLLIPINSQKCLQKSQIMSCLTCVTTGMRLHVLSMYSMCLWKLKFEVWTYIPINIQKVSHKQPNYDLSNLPNNRDHMCLVYYTTRFYENWNSQLVSNRIRIKMA